MYKFDVKYTLENYLEYYKYSLFKSKIYRDLLFMVIFVAFGVFFLIDQSEATEGTTVPILAIAMGVLFPLMNVITLPILKKQLTSKQGEIDRTHIIVTFNEDEIIYENLTVREEVPVEEPKEVDEKVEEPTSVEEKAEELVAQDEVAKEKALEDANHESTDSSTEEEKGSEEENVFSLKYSNFQKVMELDQLFLFYLDRQTIVILPKSTFIGETNNFVEFKQFITTKINPKRVHFKKAK